MIGPRVFLIGALLAAMLTGCDRQNADPSPSASTRSATPSVEQRDAAARAAALDAYRGMWAAFAQAGQTADPQAPALARYASGRALDQLVSALRAASEAGQVYRGRPVLTPTVQRIDAASAVPTATLADCADATGWIIYDRQGKRVGGDHQHRKVTATAIETVATWKVTTLSIGSEGSC